MNTTKVEKIAKKELIEKCWDYLNDNFHKFTQVNKIKIALALALKDLPTQFGGDMPSLNVFVQNILNKAGLNEQGKTNPSHTESQSRLN